MYYEFMGKLKLLQDYSNTYGQIHMTDTMIKFAKQHYTPDWILIADGDEFFLSNYEI